MTALLWAFDPPPPAEEPPSWDVAVHEPEVAAWIEQMDGTRLGMLRSATVDPVEQRYNDVGTHGASTPLDDPGLAPMLVGGELVNWETHDRELVIYREGEKVQRGPIFKARHANGIAYLSAFDQGAYLAAQDIGGEPTNYFPGGYLDLDPTLSEWDVDDGVTATVYAGPERLLWRRDRGLSLQTSTLGAGATTTGYLPVGRHRNYAYVIARVRLENDPILPVIPDRPELEWVVAIDHYTAPLGSGAFGRRRTYIAPIADYAGGWATTEPVNVPQLPNMRNRYDATVYAGVGGQVLLGELELVRDANVSARAGTDIATLFAALYQHLIGLLGPDRFARRVTEVGVDLVDDVRHLVTDHEKVRSILDTHANAGAWWTEHVNGKVVFCWGQRGRLLDTWFSSEQAADLEGTWDASAAINELTVAAPDLDGPAVEEVTVSSGGPVRLPGRVRVTGALSPRDLDRWGLDELAVQATKVEVTASIKWTGDDLGRVRPGDRVSFDVTDGPNDEIDYAYEATIQALTWEPSTDALTPAFRRVAA